MTLDKSLDSILTTGSKTKIIRLFVSRKDGFRASGRQIATLVNISAPAAHTALKELYNLDILKRDIIGRQHIYSLDNNSKMVKEILRPMFQKENSLKREIGNYFIKQARNRNIYSRFHRRIRALSSKGACSG